MAQTAAFLKSLRKRYGLGEFKKGRKSKSSIKTRQKGKSARTVAYPGKYCKGANARGYWRMKSSKTLNPFYI